MTDFDYKKYSLENLEKWLEDAMTSAEASPQEIYDTIHKVVSENYYHHKHHASRAYELMEKLNGSDSFNLSEVLKEREYYEGWDSGTLSISRTDDKLTCDKDDKSPECQKAWNDFWEENYYPEERKMEDIMPPWGHSDMEALRYSEEELNAMCEKAASDEENNKCREYNLREAEYYDKRAKLDAQQDKVVKWQLPVEVDGISGEYYIQFPDDLMEASGIKEDDLVEWIDRKDGSFELRKVTKPIGMEES